MTPQEQNQLYLDLKAAHPGWSNRFLSGYVHGANDEPDKKRPSVSLTAQAHDLDHYALGYLTGFSVHRGPDAEMEPWFGFAEQGE
jgi:hypothetical protein